MQKALYVVALSCACASAACGTETATAVYAAPPDSGGSGDAEKACASTRLVDRITHSSVTLPDNIRYKRAGYFFGLPQDDRIAFSMLNDSVGMVAWVDAGGSWVHVTPLTVGPEGISRFLTDVLVEGTELSGLVALDDGFALLTRRTDLGEPLGEDMTPMQATFLVRWQNGRVLFDLPLTGTKSIVDASDVRQKRDFPNPVSGFFNSLSGRLAFNGSHFAAYFSVRGAAGDAYEGMHGDKFVEIDEAGNLVRSWRMGCRQSLGNRLVAEPNNFLAFCMSDGRFDDPGLQLVSDQWRSTRLAPENATGADIDEFRVGYVGGNFGSAVATPSGYLVAWASRGIESGTANNPNPQPGYSFHEPAVAVLDRQKNVVAVQRRWPFLAFDAGAPAADTVNVHAAKYGDKVLLVWETITDAQFRQSVGYSTGQYGGTHFRLVDAQGKSASDEEVVMDAIAPNGQDEIVTFPNGDLGWAYVPEVRDFQTVLSANAIPNLPPISEIKFVRLRYCPP